MGSGRAAMKRTPLRRRQPGDRARANGVGVPRRPGVSPASPVQRDKVRDLACIVCREQPVTPCHVIDRSITTVGQDDALAVVPVCQRCHRQYDEYCLDLLPFLEPHWRDELAFAVQRIGLVATFRRVTNDRHAAEHVDRNVRY